MTAPERNPTPTPTQIGGAARPRLALVFPDKIGDALVFLLLAENMRLNGFEVDCYGHLPKALEGWLVGLRAFPFRFSTLQASKVEGGSVDLAALEGLKCQLDGYDFVISYWDAWLCEVTPSNWLAKLRRCWLLLNFSPVKQQALDVEMWRERVSQDAFDAWGKNLACGASGLDYLNSKGMAFADIVVQYVRGSMGLSYASRDIPLRVPDGLVKKRHAKRVVLSPDSGGGILDAKNWSESGFITTMVRLREEGMEPVVVVHPDSRPHWERLLAGQFPVARTNSLAALAAYIYESAGVIANDSGNGHIASFLGVPVITITKRRDPNFRWRPSWGVRAVICPWVTFRSFQKRVWRPFVRPERVVRKALELFTLE